MLSILSCVCWQSVCLLWRNVCLGLLPIHNPFFMKHFTAPLLGELGLKKTCPIGCGLVQSQTRKNEDLFCAQEVWGPLRIPRAGDLWGGPWVWRLPVLTFSASPGRPGGPASEGSFRCLQTRKEAHSFINVLTTLRTLCVEWCLWSVSNKSWTGKHSLGMCYYGIKKLQGEVIGGGEGGKGWTSD